MVWEPDFGLARELAAVSRGDLLTSASARVAPREASRVAVARPIPEAAPVRAIYESIRVGSWDLSGRKQKGRSRRAEHGSKFDEAR